MSFQLTVPGSDLPLVEHDNSLTGEGHTFGFAGDGIWDLVLPDRRAVLDTFATDYAAVRSAEHRELTSAEVQTLPVVKGDHPLAAMWAQRATSHARFKQAIAAASPGTAIDIGAGCGWLAADLARDQWNVAAIDVTVEGGDGLAAARHHQAEILLVRAEMQALPFASNSIDLAVFNASLHYAADVVLALHEAARVLRPSGTLVVIDSPVFDDESAGHAMVAEFADHSQQRLGLPAARHEGPGFVTQADLRGFNFTRTEATSGLRRRIHKWRGAQRAGRETASRPLLMTTIGDRP